MDPQKLPKRKEKLRMRNKRGECLRHRHSETQLTRQKIIEDAIDIPP